MNGRMSATTASGATTIISPNSIIRNPTSRRIHVIIVFSACAASNIAAALSVPWSSRRIVVP